LEGKIYEEIFGFESRQVAPCRSNTRYPSRLNHILSLRRIAKIAECRAFLADPHFNVRAIGWMECQADNAMKKHLAFRLIETP